MKFSTICILVAFLAALSQARCYCNEENNLNSAIQKKYLVFQGQLSEVRKMDTSETLKRDSGSYLLKFAVDTILYGRGGKTISIRWQREDAEPCFSKRKGFAIGRKYKIGVYQYLRGPYRGLERRKNPLYPNDYVPSKVKSYPSFSCGSYVEEVDLENRN